MQIDTSYTSPNFEGRAEGQAPSMILIHYTGMQTGREALERLCDPAAKVSAHYVIEEDGRIFALVSEDKRAWHAGVSCWEGQTDINSLSIGIELVNPGHEWGYRPFPPAQMQSLAALCKDIMARHEIKTVLGHSDVAPDRKQDPGELFDWAWLAAQGIDNIHA
ncbi:MAG: N-acetylmuramoyl-L-alanine amidase [Alphaproteobacteria bacterium]|nr:N-acetylmuramoyl-L-alanine amidase [Alphaproteobacteria bacterium]